jgi:hypothetical protein
MNLGEKNSTLKNKVFDGAYSVFITSIDPELESFWISTGINPSGVTGILVKYTSGNKNIESGFYATGLRPNIGYQSGASSVGDLSGYLYYRVNVPIFGTCHGFGNDENTWYSGYNFYNAFHPEGFVSPPFGQNFSTYKAGNYGFSALDLNGSCSSLTSKEYNDLFGIVSQSDDGITASAEEIDPQADSFLNSPAIACPQDLSVAYYWREKQYKIIAGTAGAITANIFFNNNPIPISLDMFDIKTSFRYDSSGEKLDGDLYEDSDGRKKEKILYTIKYLNGKPVPKYYNLVTKGSNPLLSKTCYGSITEGKLVEGSVLGSTQITSLLIDSPDILGEPSKSAFDPFVWWNSWHFLFKENSDGFPFQNDYKSYSTEGGDYFGLAKTPNSANYGSKIFKAELSDPDHYWENRQCPGIVDFLPHTFGASIYACPSYYFDVPYYAALNKFGFYGVRFFNGCVSLNLNYPSSGYNPNSNPPSGAENALELPGEGYSYVYPEEDEPDEDVGINYGNNIYDNLLNIAKSEESVNDFFALNKSFFLWANYQIITGINEYNILTGKYSFFSGLLSRYLNEFDLIFPSGKNDLLSNKNWFQLQESKLFFDTGFSSSLLSNNENYKQLTKSILNSISPEDLSFWDKIEKEFSNYVLFESGIVDTGFYDSFEKAKIERFQTRYLENFVQGNAIDLYPSNKITFGFDYAKNFIDSPSWGKAINLFGLTSKFEDSGLDRRYFVGAYAEALDFVGYSEYINLINSQIENHSFYPGYFNSKFGKDFQDEEYLPVLMGNAFSGEEINKNTITGGRNIFKDGWFALGYGGMIKLKNSYSCFTPIFIQQPINTVHCKIGQSPTFRCLAVDYHTIPEDKINDRYPEIIYWTKKLKIIDSKYKNKYPLSYKWFRIPKSSCGNNFDNFLLSGYFTNTGTTDYFHNPTGFPPLEPSDISGKWCCLEGDGPNCTLIHPKECIPVFSGNASWSSKYEGTPGFEDAKRNNFYMKLKKGAIKDEDDEYYYFCMTKGRFGIRISEPSELFVDETLRFDISVQNGGNSKINPKISFDFGTGIIEIGEVEVPSYGGFYKDSNFIPENIVQQKIPPPNKGFGDVYSYKFVGTWGYGGALQTYSPGTLDDTRGLKETWGRFLHYGSLIKYQKQLSQSEGDLIYGTPHLPTCVSGLIKEDKYGLFLNISVDTKNGSSKIIHWANMQDPIVSTDGKFGVLWKKLGNAGELYNPISYLKNGAIDSSISPGLGQWQWGNNLGTIHKFGYTSPNSELKTSPGFLNDDNKNELKEKLLKNSLDGPDCGWNEYGLGRNMLYWIEGFSSFYLFCDPIKKKNVTNYNYMGPALRQTNSSIQHFWLGKPSNTYLKRYPMFGPYAYQWKVMPHNRDRNGNGMSEGFYSYGWGTNYNSMYDAPAIYGLFRQYKEPSEGQQEEINQINNLRTEIFGVFGQAAVRSTRFGFTYGNGGAVRYGNIWIGKITETGTGINYPNYKIREYVKSGEYLSKYPKFGLYGCDDSDLKNGDCFDPCLSIRYPFGFLPGGKKQKLTSAVPSGSGYSIVANNIFSGDSFYEKTSYLSGEFFRGPFGTPHHIYLKGTGKNINGFSPCSDGGADHCNYLTPTINLGASSYLSTEIPTMISASAVATSSIDYVLPNL